MNGSRMAVHVENECEFRPIFCRDCKIKVPYEEYINHLINIERLPKQVATECSTGFDIEEEDFTQSIGGLGQSWEPTWLHCHNLDFFCHLESVGNFWWIYVIGFAPDDVLQDFLCDILVWNRDKKQEFRFHGPVHSYRKSGEDILTSGQCLITSENSIRSILNEGGIDVVVCIVTTSAYRAPTSRNTGQAIYSPLTLRPNASNTGAPAGHLTQLLSALSTHELENPGSSNTRRSISGETQPETLALENWSSLEEGVNNSGSNGAPIVPFIPIQQAQAPQALPRTSSISQVSQVPTENSGSRHRISRAEQASNRAPTRSRSLDGGRRRRHHRHTNAHAHNNPS
ncbi:unnamed protein product [Allacma fusca]|uniref:Uncharacterized protein n=1 Tax=Allacma fusca TaxID=39272 RepID=A0A8J2LJM9_9HEXA|nr:unnamed protein product [Allacma fusca]